MFFCFVFFQDGLNLLQFFWFQTSRCFSKLVRKEVQVENSKQMLGDLMRGPTNKSF